MGESSDLGNAGMRCELRLVTSGVLTFGQLVPLERRIRALGVVRSLRLEDFRNGVATHSAVLRLPLTAQELADLVRGAGGPDLVVEGIRGSAGLELQAAQESAGALRSSVA